MSSDPRIGTDPVTDEARIARLTELARRVWPDERSAEIRQPVGKAMCFGGSGYQLVGIGSHPRALDALEAALLVLAGETPRERAQAFFASLPDPPHGLLAVGQVADEPPAWVEQLDDDADAELEAIARKIMHSQSERDAYAVLDHYARSVRRRAYAGRKP